MLVCDDISEPVPFAHTILEMNRDSSILDPIADLEEGQGRDVPQGFLSHCSRSEGYESSHLGITTVTPFGRKLQYVTASALSECLKSNENRQARLAKPWRRLGI